MANEGVDIIIETVEGLRNSLRGRHGIDFYSISTISMVPSRSRDVNPTCFNPRMVAIGPLHKEDENLQAFEGRKMSLVQDMLDSLDSPPEQTLEECVRKVANSIELVRATYNKMKTYTDVELAKMMVMDACFIIHTINVLSLSTAEELKSCRFSPEIYDLMLLENQIPFFILQEIFNSTILKSNPTTSLTGLLLKLAQIFNVFETDITIDNNFPSTHDHILGFLDRCYRSPTESSPSPGFPSSTIHSIVELERAGVIVNPNLDERWQMAMEFKASRLPCYSWFWGKPTLGMPVLRIDNLTELVLRNLLAYEQTGVPGRREYYVTSYVMAMDMLVDTQEDITKLIESKVVVNHLGSNEKAADMMNGLYNEIVLPCFYYVDEWRQIDAHCNRYWPRNIAALKRTYFNSPWNIIALLAGITLFGLTVVQTIYTVNAV